MITIVGAGPVGSYCAYLLAKDGKEVSIIEEHKKIGLPIQCTGIVTSAINDIISLDKKTIINEVNKIKVISPNRDSTRFLLQEKELILDRKKFDESIYNKAIEAGAKSYINHKFIDYKPGSVKVKDTKNKKIKKIKSDILIGADGPLSAVAKKAGLFSKRKFLLGIQARVKIKSDPSTYQTFFGKKFPRFFGWLVPESKDIARIGLATNHDTKDYFDVFIKKFKGKIIEKQAGLIPIYNRHSKTRKDNVLLVGDAACQVKNTTGGGLVPGLTCAKALADSINGGKDYEKEWRKKMGKELFLHSLIRRTLDKFSDKDYNKLISLLKNNKTKRVLEKHNRDYPSKMLLELIIKEPRFLGFIGKLL